VRPLSFTRNLGGFEKAYNAIRRGYAQDTTVKQFRERCGLSSDVSLLVTEFILATKIRDGQEIIVVDELITETLTRPFGPLIARLYFFAVNLNMPGDRLKEEHLNPAEMQNTLVREYLFRGNGFRVSQFDKDRIIEPAVKTFGGFTSEDALRKWVNNYSYMAEQCSFVATPDGRYETFADSWGLLALRLFFERYSVTHTSMDPSALIAEARSREIYKLIGVPPRWLENRLEGAAEMFVSGQDQMLVGFPEGQAERKAAQLGTLPPPLGGEARRREATFRQILRRGENRRFLLKVYQGVCQISGVKLVMPDRTFSVDCAHIRPLGSPYFGKDVVGNMFSLSPNMHRLFDRKCVRIDPESLSIKLLHGNDLPHRSHLLIRENHRIDKANLSYYLAKILK